MTTGIGEPVAWQFRQRSGVGKGPQSQAPWCDWCGIEREDYERYLREPSPLIQVRPLYASPQPAQCSADSASALRDAKAQVWVAQMTFADKQALATKAETFICEIDPFGDRFSSYELGCLRELIER